MQFVNQPNHWEQSLQHPLQPDVSMPMYEAHNSPSSAPMSPHPYDNAINTPLPPSPIPSSMMNSPIIDDHHDSPFQMNYDDVNTLHF
jgi:hypothetical protein